MLEIPPCWQFPARLSSLWYLAFLPLPQYPSIIETKEDVPSCSKSDVLLSEKKATNLTTEGFHNRSGIESTWYQHQIQVFHGPLESRSGTQTVSGVIKGWFFYPGQADPKAQYP